MLKIGIIGAGSIAEYHIGSYLASGKCEIKAIADINREFAKQKADKYNIPDIYEDYHELLKDESIEAVSIVTPTFTHKWIMIDAIKAGKHILCEKPPALNAEETRECCELAKKSDKVIMFGLVCRFGSHLQYLKEYVESGKMGKIMTVEAQRIFRCSIIGGWFANKKMSGGGPLIDGGIHELDSALYVMGYPKPKTVVGYTSDINKDLPDRLKGKKSGWTAADNSLKNERDVENVASGYVTFENGSSLFIKTSTILNSVTEGTSIEFCGEKSGALLKPFAADNTLSFIDTSENYMKEFKPILDKGNIFQEEINHFIDCCINDKECIVKLDEVVRLMEIIDAIYKSAETGKAIQF